MLGPIMGMGCFRVIQILVKFLQACKVSSPTDTINEHWKRNLFKQDLFYFGNQNKPNWL
jgi:hypothetical protein